MMKNLPVLLSTAYLPPIEYFKQIVSSKEIIIEGHENFIKQTYRNRCVILGANGSVSLVIPVEKGRGKKKKPIRDIKIFNDTNWQRNHWRTIFSAYNSSPFFEFYKDDLLPFYEKKWDYLFDFNMALLETVIEILEINVAVNISTEYFKETENIIDCRSSISPKNNFEKEFKIYTQVFDEKFGFTPNLSIIDLIFNKGPESLSILGERD